MPAVTVIVPVYNTERFLPRCLDSLKKQTFKDFEVLLLDDGSTDNSGIICRAYAAHDSRMRLITLEHGGVGAARNRGLDEAEGRFVMFCDSDDYVAPGWMEALYMAALEHPMSLCNCEYAMATPSKGTVKPKLLPGLTKSQTIEKRAFFPLLYCGQMMHLWTRIFSAEVIREHGLRFRELLTEGEDMIFICDYLHFCESFYFIHQCLYFWANNGTETITRGFSAHYFDDMKQIYLARREHVAAEHMQDFYDYSFVRFMRCTEFVWDERNKESDSEKTRYCQRMFSDEVFQETAEHASAKVCLPEEKAVLKAKRFELYREYNEKKRRP